MFEGSLAQSERGGGGRLRHATVRVRKGKKSKRAVVGISILLSYL